MPWIFLGGGSRYGKRIQLNWNSRSKRASLCKNPLTLRKVYLCHPPQAVDVSDGLRQGANAILRQVAQTETRKPRTENDLYPLQVICLPGDAVSKIIRRIFSS